MKKRKIVALACLLLSGVILSGCSLGAPGAQGPQGEQGEKGQTGRDGVSVVSITKTSSAGLVDIYTVTYSNGTTSSFTIVNGEDGSTGIQGIQGPDGYTPTISIGVNGNWYVDGVDTNIPAQGPKGEDGKDGVSVVSIEKTGSEELIDTYTITYSNGTTSFFTITNGKDGIEGIQGIPGEDGHTPIVTIGGNGNWYVDGVDTGKSSIGVQGEPGKDGVGVTSITKTSTNGLEDTYTITYSDGSTSTFIVTNGKDGDQGIQGVPGQDGYTPVVTIGENGNWFVDGKDTNQHATGPKGEDGQDGVGVTSITKTSSEDNVDTYTITYSDGSTSTFTITNGSNGIQGIQGETGPKGDTPVISIVGGYWYIDGVNTYVRCTLLARENKSPLLNKTVCILGDSISTFAGYIPVNDGVNLAHRARYPQSNLLTDVNLTWWMRLINDNGARLGINESWAGSMVANSTTGNSGDQGEDACMASMTRIRNIGSNGTPDIIFFYGGTNDIGHGYTLGNFDTSASYTLNTTATKWSTFADAYKDCLMRMQYMYPKTKIVAMLPTYTKSYYTASTLYKYNEEIKKICGYFGVDYVDLRKAGITTQNVDSYLPDGIHPNANAMKLIENQLNGYLNDITLEDFEKDTLFVTQQLSRVTSSNTDTKLIQKGETFETTLTIKEGYVLDQLQVLYGDDDITETAYSNGVVKIENVSKNIKIIAHAIRNGAPLPVPECDNSHAQDLPYDMDSETNLWEELTPESSYYTGSAWGPNGNVGSITFAVEEGYHIYASSFEASPQNGGTSSGIRITFFNDNTVVNSLSPADVYKEFSENGYITIPSGVNCINVPMWNSSSSSNVCRILNIA